MADKEIRITRKELYAFVILTFLLIGALASTGIYRATPLGMGVATFVIALLVLPAQRVLVRAYYGREMAVAGSVAWAAGATALVFGAWWLVQRALS